MLYAKTTNKQRAKDFQSLLARELKNKYWIEKIIVKEKITFYKNKRVKNSEWIVKAKLAKPEQLSLFPDLPMCSEEQVKKMLEQGKLLFKA